MAKGYKITGMDELFKNIKRVKSEIVRDSARSAGRAAMRIVQEDAQRRAQAIDDPKTPTHIYQNIAMTTRWDKSTGIMRVKVGVRGGARYRKGDKDKLLTTYFRFVELGTERSRARPFLRPALKNNHQAVLKQFLDEMNRQLDRRI
ncbi:HK97-gp10 family putative phage morphogenesis protein [Salinicola sp. CPA57]|uniref:HK97-gp10 family putative phage morphogenesis protein n=1 Tax=Salinicola sp. CPA57 TaxID=1949080 RepID=UPI000DA1BED3|nr:HK97-gp10 family putative phage morphogenesis protein [Salinicola sp. CPA57]